MMIPHRSSKSISALSSMSNATATRLATQEIVSSTRNEKTNSEPEVKINKVAEPFAGIMTDKSTLPHHVPHHKAR